MHAIPFNAICGGILTYLMQNVSELFADNVTNHSSHPTPQRSIPQKLNLSHTVDDVIKPTRMNGVKHYQA
jgi:hypothetical protein